MDIGRRWMSSPAIVAPATTLLPQAHAQMQEQRICRLLVVDAAGRLIGIVTEGDINRVSDSPATDVCDYNLYHRVGDLPIRDMTQAVVTVAPDTAILEVAQLLEHRIGGVPVVVDGHVIGVITESDLFRLIVARETQGAQPSGEGTAEVA